MNESRNRQKLFASMSLCGLLEAFVLVSVDCVIGKEKKDRGRVGQLNCESDERDRGNRRGVGMDI